MSRKSLKFGNVMLCDYVAKGENNKFILVNTYSGDIIVQQFPAHLPLGLYCEYLPDNIGPVNLRLMIKIGSKTIIEAGVLVDIVEKAPQVIAIPNFLLPLNANNSIEISATAEGYKDTVVMRKKIYAGQITHSSSAVSPLPHEQSSPDVPAS